MNKTIAIISGSGGTGKTTLTINLAAALQELKEDAIIVDANIETPHIGLHLGDGWQEPTIHDYIEGKNDFHQTIHYHPAGLKYVPGRPTAEIKEKIPIPIALRNYSKTADYVLYDGSPGIKNHAIKAAEQAIIVMTPDLHSVTDAARIIKEAMKQQKIITAIVLNKNTKKGINIEAIESLLGTGITTIIPYDEKIRETHNQQEIYLHKYPNKKPSKEIKDLAKRISRKYHF